MKLKNALIFGLACYFFSSLHSQTFASGFLPECSVIFGKQEEKATKYSFLSLNYTEHVDRQLHTSETTLTNNALHAVYSFADETNQNLPASVEVPWANQTITYNMSIRDGFLTFRIKKLLGWKTILHSPVKVDESNGVWHFSDDAFFSQGGFNYIVKLSCSQPEATVERYDFFAYWERNFKQALIKAEAEDKKVLVFFTGEDWCAACYDFKNNVAHTKAFLQRLEPFYVFFYANVSRVAFHADKNADPDPNWELFKKYKLQSWPSLAVLDSQGQFMNQIWLFRQDTVIDELVRIATQH